MKYYQTGAYRTFQWFNYLIMLLIAVIMLYPFVYCVSVSISDPYQIQLGNVKLFPVGINFQAYQIILKSQEILAAFNRSVLYAVVGTLLSLLVTALAAYPLSISRFRGKPVFVIFFAITMYFSGGLVPAYLNIKNLGLIDSIWAIVLPAAFNIFYILILMASFKSVPSGLNESAYIDGANDFTILIRIMIPLTKATFATILLFSAVRIWNDYFSPLLYLNTPSKFPLTLVMRRYLIEAFDNPVMDDMLKDVHGRTIGAGIVDSMKMALIVISVIPIVLIYPFLQKYFTKGVMLGSLKG